MLMSANTVLRMKSSLRAMISSSADLINFFWNDDLYGILEVCANCYYRVALKFHASLRNKDFISHLKLQMLLT